MLWIVNYFECMREDLKGYITTDNLRINLFPFFGNQAFLVE